MLFASWNIRGLGREEKRKVVLNLVKEHKPMVLFLQETKLNYFDNSVINSLGGRYLTRGMGVEADGSAGGLVSLWNDDLFTVIACIKSDRCIALAGELVKQRKMMVFCNVYAANVESDRKILWEFIIQAQVHVSLPLVHWRGFQHGLKSGGEKREQLQLEFGPKF
ncbi:hypothetical protein Dsin_015143 [Dipteronia sinensis]|uniref:Endonuclease/exonuclease/phosphatase domain-containing protein n=1 Tax=Dipteronia sinensis TaxID=43782 RepID=A0AAE0AN88_9ROSI|nr:hypothetical protein Dsin_015143 [Dipteronia sinensis]